ncbi:hypothetical protein [Plastoroseomonas hellenica]|uniref:hypothetical protein n=1 Tax=Plastoroseomonas hellenica TaxID=2687306 RepID=UPI001BAC9515|nr:hypothetical protein [Plastoroseomonas hellenica]MBR0644024.1 hypothetical protein [Plastoroseomonas hellenica]
MGVDHTGRQNRALFLLAKLIAHNLTLLSIIDRYRASPKGAVLLDHFSIAALARTIVDASLMIMYISHPSLTRDAWNLRRYVLYLHDITNRKRFISAMPDKDEEFNSSYQIRKPEFQAKIRDFASRMSLPERDIEELIKGQKVFVEGARGAVREAGWDVDEFEFIQSYLSAYVHSHPVSFMRAIEHGISFQDPSDFQVHMSRFGVQVAARYTAMVADRMSVFAATKASDPLGQVDD